MRVTPSRLVILALLAAIVMFCVVQDRITAAAVGRYVTLKRAAMAGAGPQVTLDEVMRPGVRRSVWRGALWGLVTLGAGTAAAVIWSRRR